MNAEDERFLRRAIELAGAAREAGNAPFGSLLVSAGGEILSEDVNTTLTERDITAHPELKLARWAAAHLAPEAARETTMYTSCQPCPMCAGALARSGLGRVVFALGSDQLEALKPPTAARPPEPPAYEGPALFDAARMPVDGYY
jgi:tRNA(Arg) A34 adenosine deaminase TadA